MIRREDLDRIAVRWTEDRPILSLLLDVSPDPGGRRPYPIFLNQKWSEHRDLDDHHPRNQHLRAALDRVERWLERSLRSGSRSVAVFAELGGEWFEAHQFPIDVQSRLVVANRPIIAPLVRALEGHRHRAIVLVEREHLRMLSVHLGVVLDHADIRRERPLAARHEDAGYLESRFQGRRLEQTRQLMAGFAEEIESFVERCRPEDLVLLGTAENVARLRAALPERLLERIVYSGPGRIDEPSDRIVAEVEPILQALDHQEELALSMRFRDRVRQDYLATAGLQSTLSALQSGRVETLLIGETSGAAGSRCPRCGFLFGPGVAVCAYDGTATESGVALVEELLRMAVTSGAGIRFLEPAALGEARGFGALLRY